MGKTIIIAACLSFLAAILTAHAARSGGASQAGRPMSALAATWSN
ncbi:hypothetical protein [Novosphingobium sp. Leaf2]|nr:hypothetical protein [Novosphingobium sp. Leaf2]